MLTLGKIATYEAFGGDRDGHARSAASGKNPSMSDADWALIDELLTGLDSVASGLASPGFADQLERKLRVAAQDEGTRTGLRTLTLRLRKPA